MSNPEDKSSFTKNLSKLAKAKLAPKSTLGLERREGDAIRADRELGHAMDEEHEAGEHVSGYTGGDEYLQAEYRTRDARAKRQIALNALARQQAELARRQKEED